MESFILFLWKHKCVLFAVENNVFASITLKCHFIAIFVCIRNCLLFTVHTCTMHLCEAWHFPFLSIIITVHLLSNEYFVVSKHFYVLNRSFFSTECKLRWLLRCDWLLSFGRALRVCRVICELGHDIYDAHLLASSLWLCIQMSVVLDISASLSHFYWIMLHKLATTKAFGVKKRHAKRRWTSTERTSYCH